MRTQFPAFEEHLRARQLSPSTIKTYLAELQRFAAYLDESGDTLAGLTLQQATRYLAREGRSSGTTLRARVILAQFLAWGGHTLAGALGQLRIARAPRPAPGFLTGDEERALRLSLKARADQRHQARDRVILCLLLDTGMRVAELVGLQVGDVDLEAKTLRLAAKGGKRPQKFITRECRQLLQPLVRGKAKEDPVFQSAGGHAITDRQVRRILNHWASLTGITKDVHPHLLRHTFATSLLQQTGNLRLVQLALDHESPKTTAIYAHVVDGELQSAMEKRGEIKLAELAY